MTHLYTIIPDLVSIETDSATIPDFLLAHDLSFYPSVGRLKFHYGVFFSGNVSLPKKWDYRIGNYLIHGNSITYSRPIFMNIGFRYTYDFREKIFTFNSFYKNHYVNIGDIFTVGRHLFHVIESDLAAERKFILLGSAMKKNKKAIVVLAPYGNGKTTFVNKAIDHGYAYISENFLVIDIIRGSVFGVTPVFRNKNRYANKELKQKFLNGRVSIIANAQIKDFYLISSKFFPKQKLLVMANYVDTYSGYYKKNNLVRSILYYFMKNAMLEKNYTMFTNYLAKRVKLVDDFSLIPL